MGYLLFYVWLVGFTVANVINRCSPGSPPAKCSGTRGNRSLSAPTVMERGVMPKRTLGATLLAGVFFVVGLAGLYACLAAWPRRTGTSPLMALLALAWGVTYIVTAILTWRGSRLATFSFVAAIGLLLLPARFLVPDGGLVVPAAVAVTLVAVLGVRYLGGLRGSAA
jgi:hypothetical protein